MHPLNDVNYDNVNNCGNQTLELIASKHKTTQKNVIEACFYGVNLLPYTC